MLELAPVVPYTETPKTAAQSEGAKNKRKFYISRLHMLLNKS